MDLLMLPFYILVPLFGILVGSFLNVCILRIPAGESIVTGPSHCMSCGKRLKPWELVPLFSWLALGGRCSGCKAPISPQYPLIEGANGLLWLVALACLGVSWDLAVGCAFLSVLLVISVIDGRTMEIPPSLNLCILLLGLVQTLLHRQQWSAHVLGFAAVSGVLLILFYLTGGAAIGGGDVKLMAAAGLLLGWKGIVFAFLTGCILGAVIHLLRMKFFGAGRQLAMGPYLSAGCAIALLWGDRLIAWYLGLLGF